MTEQIGLEAVLNDKKWQEGVARYIKSVNEMDTKTGGLSRSLGSGFASMGKSVLGFAQIAGKALLFGAGSVAAGIATLGVLATKTAIDFQSAWAGVVKTTDGLVDEFGNLTAVGKELQDGMRALAIETGVSVEELAGIGELGGQLGVAREDLLEFTETIAAMGVSTNLTTDAAAEGFAQIANIMGTVAKEGGAAFEKLGSTIVALGNNSATTEADILNFAQRIAGAAAIAGITEADIFGIGAAFASVGVEAEAGGTAVQKVLLAMTEAVQGSSREALPEWQAALSRIQEAANASLEDVADAVHEGGAALEEFAKKAGVSAETVTTALNLGMAAPSGQVLRDFADVAGITAEEFKTLFAEDAAGAFELFVQGLGTAGDEAIALLDDLGLSDQRLVRAFLSLSNAGDLLTDSMDLANQAWEDNNALSQEAEQRYKTAQYRIQGFKNQIKDAGITIGTALLPYLGELLDIISPVIANFAEKLPDFLEKNVIPVLRIVVTWIGTNLPIAIQKLSNFWSTVLLPALQMAWSYLQSTIIPILQTVWQWLATNLPVAIAFVTEHWEEFKGALIAIGAVLAAAGIVAAIAGIIAALNPVTLAIGAIVAAAAFLGAAWAGNWGGIRDTLTEVWYNTIQPALVQLQAWLAEHLPIAIEILKGFWENTLKPAMQAVWAFIVETLIPAFGDVVAWLAENIPVAIAAAADFWENTLQPALQAVWDFIQNSLIPIFESVVSWLSENIPAAITSVSDFWENTLQPALQTVWDFISAYLIPIFEDVITIVDETMRIALEGLALIWEETLQPALEKVWDFLSANILPIFEELTDFITSVVTEVISSFVSDELNDLAEGLSVIKTWLEKVKGWLDKLATALADFSWGDIGEGAMPKSPPKLAQGFAMITAQVGELQKAFDDLSVTPMDPIVKAIMEAQGRPLDDLLAAGGKLGGFGGGFLRYGQGESQAKIDALKKELEALSGDQPLGMSDHQILQRRLEITRQIAEEEAKIAEREQQALELQKQQEQLGFLKDQMNLLAFIREQGLDPADILGDIQLGLDASVPDLVAATAKAMQAMIDAVNSGLSGNETGPSTMMTAPSTNMIANSADNRVINMNNNMTMGSGLDFATFRVMLVDVLRSEFGT